MYQPFCFKQSEPQLKQKSQQKLCWPSIALTEQIWLLVFLKHADAVGSKRNSGERTPINFIFLTLTSLPSRKISFQLGFCSTDCRKAVSCLEVGFEALVLEPWTCPSVTKPKWNIWDNRFIVMKSQKKLWKLNVHWRCMDLPRLASGVVVDHCHYREKGCEGVRNVHPVRMTLKIDYVVSGNHKGNNRKQLALSLDGCGREFGKRLVCTVRYTPAESKRIIVVEGFCLFVCFPSVFLLLTFSL